jgi:hypothetical protein
LERIPKGNDYSSKSHLVFKFIKKKESCEAMGICFGKWAKNANPFDEGKL